MNRWICFFICILLGLTAVVCGLLLPVYLRAVDADVVRNAGKGTPGLVENGMKLVGEKKLGAAQLLSQAAVATKISGQEKLFTATEILSKQRPDLRFWGSDEPGFKQLFSFDPSLTSSNQPFTDFIIRTDNREEALTLLNASSNPGVQELMRSRALTNTVIFSPSHSASGQAFDAALATCGLLIEHETLDASLNNMIVVAVAEANHGDNSERFEQMLLDFMSLGQRFNWGQLVSFCEKIPDLETLHTLADFVRKDSDLPVLYSLVEISGKPSAVAGYLTKFTESGLNDLQTSLRSGEGGVNLLLDRGQRLFQPRLAYVLGLNFSLRNPQLALTVKWVLVLVGGFFLALASHFARRPMSVLEKPLQVRGFHVAREFLFALGFLLVVLLLSEPFLAQEGQKGTMSFQLRLPRVGFAIPAGSSGSHSTIMNNTTLLIMSLFFILQALLYTASLVKLAEIRRQNAPARMKLKLLDNEEHLFDAGLYLGFLGTIISFILVSLAVLKQPSLMAAYSSTSFGILFVVLFKVAHLRPTRRVLLLEAETEATQVAAAASHMFAAPL